MAETNTGGLPIAVAPDGSYWMWDKEEKKWLSFADEFEKMKKRAETGDMEAMAFVWFYSRGGGLPQAFGGKTETSKS